MHALLIQCFGSCKKETSFHLFQIISGNTHVINHFRTQDQMSQLLLLLKLSSTLAQHQSTSHPEHSCNYILFKLEISPESFNYIRLKRCILCQVNITVTFSSFKVGQISFTVSMKSNWPILVFLECSLVLTLRIILNLVYYLQLS